MGSGWPFMPTARTALRPSMMAETGVEIVMPSTLVLSNWSAPLRTPARRSSAGRLAPSQRALPAYGPPTSLETQTSVMSASVSGCRSRSAKLSSTGRSTIPLICSVH